MKKYYIAEFVETVVFDGVRRPVLPWDGLEANVHCVYPRAKDGNYLESIVIAAVEADLKVHEQIAAAPGVTVLPDDPQAALKDVPAGKRSEVETKAAALKADVKDVTPDTSVKTVVDRIGQKLRPGFDLARLQPVDTFEKSEELPGWGPDPDRTLTVDGAR